MVLLYPIYTLITFQLLQDKMINLSKTIKALCVNSKGSTCDVASTGDLNSFEDEESCGHRTINDKCEKIDF